MRVFVALNLSDAERSRLADAAAGLRDAGFPVRWVAPENVHLTLKFLGEIPEARVPDVCSAVGEAAADLSSFAMAVGGFGAFPSLRRPQVVWVGVEPNSTLASLHESLEGQLALLGFPREDRPFRPHLTLGRTRRRAAPSEFRGLDELVKQTEYRDTFQIRSVDVMQSRLMPRGPIYSVVHSADLEP
ncbi:MAG: RNA 2',3'-cyclic phosphodiesterase [Gemmatimonadota bacterium]|nr:MAG: RNA 2',3'-cyclic phosphodiesterase [Gemmatimonadota bacterium]